MRTGERFKPSVPLVLDAQSQRKLDVRLVSGRTASKFIRANAADGVRIVEHSKLKGKAWWTVRADVSGHIIILPKNHHRQQCRGRTYLGGSLRCVVT